MKKVFFTTVGVFALALMFTTNSSSNGDLIKNTALAGGTCCSEPKSKCIMLHGDLDNHYGAPTGKKCSELTIVEQSIE